MYVKLKMKKRSKAGSYNKQERHLACLNRFGDGIAGNQKSQELNVREVWKRCFRQGALGIRCFRL